MSTLSVYDKINQLSPPLLVEVEDYVDFLCQKYRVMLSNTVPLLPVETKPLQTLTLWEAIQSFRATADFEAIGEVDEVFQNVRDHSVGREVDWS
jgi:hypothetical protein